MQHYYYTENVYNHICTTKTKGPKPIKHSESGRVEFKSKVNGQGTPTTELPHEIKNNNLIPTVLTKYYFHIFLHGKIKKVS